MIDKIEQETDRERERERESPRYKQGKYADIHMICTYRFRYRCISSFATLEATETTKKK